MNLHEQQIIEGLKQGDNWAYKQIYDQYYALLRQVASSFIKDDFSARAIIGDVIIHIFEKRETLNIHPPLRPYLVRAVVNSCLNHLKLKQRKNEVKLSSADSSESDPFSAGNASDCPLTTVMGKELHQEIVSAVERLPVECRTVFEKSRFEGKNYEEIATEMGISVNTVKYHIKNALSRLRKDLGHFSVLILVCLYG
jgi:RNA polymerase sigma-70 factor (ECF subfamily)